MIYEDSIYATFKSAAQLRFQQGETNLLEKITAETQSLVLKNQISQVESDIHIIVCLLQTLLNEPSEIRIVDTILDRIHLKLPSDSMVFLDNPNFLILEQEKKISTLQRKIESSRLYPDFTLGYFNQSNKELSTSGRFDGFQAGVAIPLIFSGQKGRIESARLNEKITEAKFSTESNSLHHQFHILSEELQKFKQSLNFFESSALNQSDLILNQANKSYRAGEIDYMEYIQNLRSGLGIRHEFLETLNQYNQAAIAIEILTNHITY